MCDGLFKNEREAISTFSLDSNKFFFENPLLSRHESTVT